MSKIAFVFPGQGSQTVGMCKDLYDNYTCARKVFEAADEALGFSISDMCFNGPEDQLRLTFNTQPAILTASVACAEVLKENGLSCEVAAAIAWVNILLWFWQVLWTLLMLSVSFVNVASSCRKLFLLAKAAWPLS